MLSQHNSVVLLQQAVEHHVRVEHGDCPGFMLTRGQYSPIGASYNTSTAPSAVIFATLDLSMPDVTDAVMFDGLRHPYTFSFGVSYITGTCIYKNYVYTC